MTSPGPAEPSRRGIHRARRPRRPRRGAAVTLTVGLVLAATSGGSLLAGGREAPAALPAGTVRTAPAAVAAVVPRRSPDPVPAAASLGPLRKPARLLHVRPVEVAVPAVGVRSTLVDLGLNTDGTLQAPADYARAGWYAGGAYPADADGPPAVIAGHVDSWNGPAVFYRLRQVRPGQQIRVTRADGSVAVFVVYAAREYPKDAFPAEAVYVPTERAEIRLITCTGVFDSSRRSYRDNLVVFAALDPSASESAP